MTMTDWYLDHACLHISGGTHISQSACLPVHATQKVDKAKHTKTPYIAQQGVIMNCMFFILKPVCVQFLQTGCSEYEQTVQLSFHTIRKSLFLIILKSAADRRDLYNHIYHHR